MINVALQLIACAYVFIWLLGNRSSEIFMIGQTATMHFCKNLIIISIIIIKWMFQKHIKQVLKTVIHFRNKEGQKIKPETTYGVILGLLIYVQ